MGGSQVWRLPRYVTLVVVLALHGALLALILRASSAPLVSLSASPPVELLYLPPVQLPRIRAEVPPPRRLNPDTSLTLTPLVFDSGPPSPSASGPALNGRGSGVDWKAEARRAVQAYEIRKREPPNDNLLYGSPAEDNWWPRARHHAGEQFKTATGDWIVWINASCYQVATSAANAAMGVMLPQTICPVESGGVR